MVPSVGLLLILHACTLTAGMFMELNNTFSGSISDPTSFLETTNSQPKMDLCNSYGDTHVSTFQPVQHFDVMGEDEWVIVEGPTHRSIAKWVVQGIQMRWQHGAATDSVTVYKNIAMRCGNFFALIAIPDTGYGSSRRIPIIGNHELFIKGSNKDTGREYTAANYLTDSDFLTGKTVSFDDGAGRVGSFITRNNLCTNDRCKCPMQTDGNRPNCLEGIIREYEFNCQGTSTSVSIRQYLDGGVFSSVKVFVPISDDTANIRVGDHLGVSGNLAGGYCGGWDAPTSRAIMSAWLTCRAKTPRPFRPSDPNENFPCKQFFVTTPATSIFAAFESWTGREFSTRSATEASKAIEETRDTAAYNRFVEQCKLMAGRVDTTVQFKNTPTNPKEMNLYSQVMDCAEDSLYGLVWNDSMMKDSICQVNAFKVRQERKDIYCAALELYNQGKRVDPGVTIAPLVSTCKTPTDVTALKDSTATIPKQISEVQLSTEGVSYWTTPLCESYVPNETDLSATNCDTWNFVDTMNELNKGFGNTNDRFVASGTYAVNQGGKTVSFEKGNFDSSVLFLGAPTFSDKTPVVPRLNKVSESSFLIFLARDKSSTSRSHGGETLNYLALDNGFDYGANARVIRTTVGGAWTTVEFGKDMGPSSQIRVFATIQSTNNGACSTCSSTMAGTPNGFVTVQVQQITSTNAQLRIQADRSTTSLVSETVGILIVNAAAGSIAGKKFITMSFTTSQTSCVGGVPTYTKEVDFGTNFKTAPVQLYQIVDNPNTIAPHVRTVTYDNPKTVITIDRDAGGPREHPGVTVHVFAVESTGPW